MPQGLGRTSYDFRHFDDVSYALDSIDAPHYVLAGAIEGGAKTIDVYIFVRKVIRVYIEHIEMDIIQSFHHPGHIHDVF